MPEPWRTVYARACEEGATAAPTPGLKAEAQPAWSKATKKNRMDDVEGLSEMTKMARGRARAVLMHTRPKEAIRAGRAEREAHKNTVAPTDSTTQQA